MDGPTRDTEEPGARSVFPTAAGGRRCPQASRPSTGPTRRSGPWSSRPSPPSSPGGLSASSAARPPASRALFRLSSPCIWPAQAEDGKGSRLSSPPMITRTCSRPLAAGCWPTQTSATGSRSRAVDRPPRSSRGAPEPTPAGHLPPSPSGGPRDRIRRAAAVPASSRRQGVAGRRSTRPHSRGDPHGPRGRRRGRSRTFP